MARVIGEIKPDWSVVRYETERDFKECKEKKGIYELCRGLLSFEETFTPGETISQITTIINSSNPKVKVKMFPCITDMPDLEELIARIHRKFIDNKWHNFANYEEMVQQVAKDYDSWLDYSKQKNDWDTEQLWSPTDAGYNLVFPIWRDVEKIISKE